MKIITSKSQAGDTIIEVLIAMAILALVMVGAYVSSSRSLRNGTDAANRQQALALAEQQAEFIKNLNSGGSVYVPPSGNFYVDNSGNAQKGSGTLLTLYTITDTYSGGLYTITANWQDTGSTVSQLQIFYKAD